VTGPDHYSRAELLAQEAYKRLGQDDEQGAAPWAALAQVHATLAYTAVTAVGADKNWHEWLEIAR
jgi:hypothetical protein